MYVFLLLKFLRFSFIYVRVFIYLILIYYFTDIFIIVNFFSWIILIYRHFCVWVKSLINVKKNQPSFFISFGYVKSPFYTVNKRQVLSKTLRDDSVYKFQKYKAQFTLKKIQIFVSYIKSLVYMINIWHYVSKTPRIDSGMSKFDCCNYIVIG